MMELRPEFSAALNPDADLFDHLMELEGNVFREMDGRRTVRFQLESKGYFLKAHSGVGWAEILKNMLQLRWPVTGADNEWQGIQRLQELNIDTMDLVGYGRRGCNPASRQSFVITEELTNTVSLETMCADWGQHVPDGQQLRLKRALIYRLAGIARTLHCNGVNHRDFYLCHFLLELASGLPPTLLDQEKIYLIDLHRVQLRAHTPRRWILRDIAALYFSSMDIGLTQRDLYRFIKAYNNSSLRVALQQRANLWRKVQVRALDLYRSFHGRDPVNGRAQDRGSN